MPQIPQLACSIALGILERGENCRRSSRWPVRSSVRRRQGCDTRDEGTALDVEQHQDGGVERDFRLALCRRAGAVQSRAADSRGHGTAPRQCDTGGVLLHVRPGGGVGRRDRQHDWRLLRWRRSGGYLWLFRQRDVRLRALQGLAGDGEAPDAGNPFAAHRDYLCRRLPGGQHLLRRYRRMGREPDRAASVRHAGQRDRV